MYRIGWLWAYCIFQVSARPILWVLGYRSTFLAQTGLLLQQGCCGCKLETASYSCWVTGDWHLPHARIKVRELARDGCSEGGDRRLWSLIQQPLSDALHPFCTFWNKYSGDCCSECPLELSNKEAHRISCCLGSSRQIGCYHGNIDFSHKQALGKELMLSEDTWMDHLPQNHLGTCLNLLFCFLT